jgi:hypothetical protein
MPDLESEGRTVTDQPHADTPPSKAAGGMADTLETVLLKKLTDLEEQVKDLVEDVHGVPNRGIEGIRKELTDTKKLAAAIQADREAINNKIRGLVWGLGFTSVASGGTLVAILRQLFWS